MSTVSGNDSLEMLMMRVKGATDDASSMSNNYRHALEAMQQMAETMQVMMAMANVMKVVATAISG